jgi:hypothetical protein
VCRRDRRAFDKPPGALRGCLGFLHSRTRQRGVAAQNATRLHFADRTDLREKSERANLDDVATAQNLLTRFDLLLIDESAICCRWQPPPLTSVKVAKSECRYLRTGVQRKTVTQTSLYASTVFYSRVLSTVIPNGVGMIRIEIDPIAELINLRAHVGVWAAIAVTYISGLR